MGYAWLASFFGSLVSFRLVWVLGMQDDHSVTLWISNLKEGRDNELAQEALWNRYFQRFGGAGASKAG